MYGKKKMMGGGKMPKPMMKKGGKMSALVIMAKPAKKAEAGAEMMGPEKPKKSKIKKLGSKMIKSMKKDANKFGDYKIEYSGKTAMPEKKMAKGGKMIKSKAPVTFAPKSAKNVKGPSPKMMKGGKMKSC